MSTVLDTKLDILTNDEVNSINRKYSDKVVDVLLQKKYDNFEKTLSWKSVKNNNKTNKFKNKTNVIQYRVDPYKFLKIPVNMREIIMNLCEKNKLSLQMLAVKTNLELFIIDNYIENYTLAASNHYWKKIKKSYQIPLQNEIQTIFIEIYRHSPKSNTKFIIERNRRGDTIDFFFESKENPDNLSFKEDIASFLSLLMLS